MTIELPKDADGREIPLDTKVLYDRHGCKNLVTSFMYVIRAEPDSWEKLDEDLHAVEACGDSPDLEDPACAYAHNIGKKCAECKLYAGDCTVNMCKDILDRIHKLRGEGK